MRWLLDFWRSSIGGKVVMAITGLLLFGFVVAHLLGNLKLLAGPESLNGYAKWLHDLGPGLWAMRIGLFVVFVLHVATGISLARDNKAARPVAYAREENRASTFASRSMLFSGLSLLAFVVYHLLHFTFGVVHPADFAQKAGGSGPGSVGALAGFDVHTMVVSGFSQPLVAIAYAAFQVVLWLHLSHGVQSLAQTLGIHHARYTPMIKTLSYVLATLVAGGNVLLALSVLLGIVPGVA
jgi:succinate dehydrogenase / fumarate reductase cytochrome b subunit